MRNNYDIIIVGGGFAGLSVAAELSKSKLNVLLIEKNKRLGINENPVRGTFKETLNKYKLNKAVIKCYNKIYFYGTKSKAEIKMNNKACLFESKNMLDILRKRIKCKKLVNCEIVNAKRDHNKIILIDNNKKEYNAKIVVDASGGNSVVAHSLCIERSKVHCTCYIATLYNCKLDPDIVYYFSSDSIANAAAWLEPLSEKKCQIGIADFEPYILSNIEDLNKRITTMVNNFKPAKAMIGNAKILKNSEKKISYPVEPISAMVQDNLIVVGDAAGQATPLLAEGIRICLEMAAIAASIIKEAFKKQDFSEKFLKKYEETWWKFYGKYAIWSILLRHFTTKFKDKEWNITIKNLDNLKQKEKEKFLKSQMTYSILKKMLSFEVTKEVFEKIIKDHLKNLSMFKKKYFVSHFV